MKALLFGATLLLLAGCNARESIARADPEAEGARSGPLRSGGLSLGPIRELRSPAAPASGEPSLSTAADGSVLLSWLERKAPESDTYSLKLARARAGTWSPGQIVAERDDFFVNWADFPGVVEAANGRLFAQWLQKSGKGTYSYDVRIASSSDGGRSWTPSVVPHRDGTPTEHGFVSLVPIGESLAAVWLDGRNMKEGHGHSGSMTLRYARIASGGEMGDEALLDDRVCECCQTGMAFTSRGPVVVYRDRSESETRDIGVIRRNGDAWSKPAVLSADGWKIDGCPVNGPQIDARATSAVVAWFTSGGGTNRVLATFSGDGGLTFSPPVAVDTGSPLGRTDVVLLPDGSALVSWIERVGESAEVRVRRVSVDGKLDPPLKVANSSPARSAGVPRMTVGADGIYIAWTEPEQPTRIRVSLIPLQRG
jgi:hypothetical protein